MGRDLESVIEGNASKSGTGAFAFAGSWTAVEGVAVEGEC